MNFQLFAFDVAKPADYGGKMINGSKHHVPSTRNWVLATEGSPLHACPLRFTARRQ